MVVVIVLIWLACGILECGWQYAYIQGKYAIVAEESRRFDTIASALWTLGGPVALFAGNIGRFTCGRTAYGWRRPGTK